MKMTPELPVDSIQKDCGVLVSTTYIQIVPHSADRSQSFLFRLSTAKFSLNNDERTYCRVYLPFYNGTYAMEHTRQGFNMLQYKIRIISNTNIVLHDIQYCRSTLQNYMD